MARWKLTSHTKWLLVIGFITGASTLIGLYTEFDEAYIFAGAATGYMVGFMMAIDRLHRQIYGKPIDSDTLDEALEKIL